ncbi:lytic murein transglycosylase [Rhodopila sp.]|uniref:lytic murein transglycosylase n=1 Tax=Rhodopila sp. TaxID=2480087 RepID=UPI002C46C35D|nr:lytic murein transglycosylase [Rhodopila sp.]HVZ07141.1 lytic murein transglycosylase [Rhodopila sp.]
MPTRRFFLAASLPTTLALTHGVGLAQDAGSFGSFLKGVKAEARRSGISATTVDRAFASVSGPNQKVLDRYRHQPEFTMTWARYRGLLVTDKRITDGRAAFAANRALFSRVEQQFGVAPGVISGIWGLESSFGTTMGDFHVIDALATLAWEGRRAAFFRGELMAALKILENGDVAPTGMMGSYAGAMGQPQFMPSSYLRYAVDLEGNGHRNIWTSKPDVLGSIANYLARSGWRSGGTWGQQVLLPAGFDPQGRDVKRSLGDWATAGIRPLAGRWVAPFDAASAIVAPDGADGEAFVVFANFAAIRRYNPSDFYAIAVGLIGDGITA